MSNGSAAKAFPSTRPSTSKNLNEVELAPWARFGAKGAFVNLADCHITTAAILEIPPGKMTNPVKHMFETWVFAISGHGENSFRAVGQRAGPRRMGQVQPVRPAAEHALLPHQPGSP